MVDVDGSVVGAIVSVAHLAWLPKARRKMNCRQLLNTRPQQFKCRTLLDLIFIPHPCVPAGDLNIKVAVGRLKLGRRGVSGHQSHGP